MKKAIALVAALCTLFAGFSMFGGRAADAAGDAPQPVGTYDNLMKIIQSMPKRQYPMYTNGLEKSAVTESATAPAPAANQAAGTAASSDYSKTNTQVAGVDEADTVKTDGKCIYNIDSAGSVEIVSAVPAVSMKLMATIKFTAEEGFHPQELYIQKNRLIVIGSKNWNMPVSNTEMKSSSGVQPGILPGDYIPNRYSQMTKAIIYDVTNPANPKQVKDVSIEGDYVSSRMVGDTLYLLSNKNTWYYGPIPLKEEMVPYYAIGKGAQQPDAQLLPANKIWSLPGCTTPSYLVAAAVDVQSESAKAEVTAYLGGGNTIYSTQKNLYAAMQTTQWPEIVTGGKQIVPEETSRIFRFALGKGTMSFEKSGSVSGTLLNQFSMDENKGYLRVAVTTGNPWGAGDAISKNHVYVLDSNLAVAGSVKDLAPGEKIYAVRFLGDKAYVVTFRTIDPLFVLDLSKPTAPKLLGALKIPGYSDYLHPYDENHIIGFGKDTMEQAVKDNQGRIIATNAYYLGMKMALFDVTDPMNPKQMFVEKIGDRGTDSELLYNHKALLFSKEKNLIAFPVSLMSYDMQSGNDLQQSSTPAYGTFKYQGAYIYSLNLKDGFIMRGRITHISDEEYQKAGQYWYDSTKNVKRILYIGDALYTVSDAQIRSNAINGLKPLGQVTLR